MKKLVTLVASVLLALSLASCGKKVDSSVWLSSLEDGKKAAQAENKKIFLFFSADDADEMSPALKEHVFTTEDFIKTYTEKYVLVNIDYSNARYEAEQEGLREDMKIFEKYNAQGVPYFLILSKEGYVITKVAFDADADLDSARITFSEAEETIARFDENLAKTKTGTTEERLAVLYLIDSNGNLTMDTNDDTVRPGQYIKSIGKNKKGVYYFQYGGKSLTSSRKKRARNS